MGFNPKIFPCLSDTMKNKPSAFPILPQEFALLSFCSQFCFSFLLTFILISCAHQNKLPWCQVRLIWSLWHQIKGQMVAVHPELAI